MAFTGVQLRRQAGRESDPEPRWSRWCQPGARWPVALVAVGFVVAKAPLLWSAPQSRDETATTLFAGLSPAELWQATSHVDRTMFPYYLLMSPLGHLADPLPAIRAASLAAVAVTIIVVGRLGARIAGPVAGIFAAMTLGAMNIVAFTSLTARSMAWYLLGFALATSALGHLIDGTTRQRRRHLVGYLLAGAFSLAMNVMSAWGFAAHLCYLVMRRPSRAAAARIVAVWAVLGVLACALVRAAWQQAGQLSWVPPLTAQGAVEVLARIAGGNPIVLAVVAGTGGYLLVQLARRQVAGRIRAAAASSIVLYAAPPAAVAVVSLVKPALEPRYLMAATIGAAGCAGLGAAVAIQRRAGRPGPAVRWVVIGSFLVLLATMTWRPTAGPTSDTYAGGTPTVRDWLRSVAAPGDTLVVRQEYAATGHLGGVAAELGDPTLTKMAQDSLRTGPDGWYAVRITSLDPWRTTPTALTWVSGRILIVATMPDPTIPDAACGPSEKLVISGSSPGITRVCHRP